MNVAPYRNMEKQQCLLVADDLTGGADAGVQFAKRGLNTLLIPFLGQSPMPCAGHLGEVLVINTITRGLSPAEAFDVLSGLLKGFDAKRFPILYKKIDAQLQRLEAAGFPSFELPRDLVSGNGKSGAKDRQALACLLGSALAGGSAIFQTFTERWTGNGGDGNTEIPQRIADVMAAVTLAALREAGIVAGELAMILTGDDTALGVLQLLDYDGIELKEELLEGIVCGSLRGGPWDGLTVVTKAGAFGKEDTLVRIMERLTAFRDLGIGNR